LPRLLPADSTSRLTFKNLNMRSNFRTESKEFPLFSKELTLASNLLYPLCAGKTPAKQEDSKMKGGLGQDDSDFSYRRVRCRSGRRQRRKIEDHQKANTSIDP